MLLSPFWESRRGNSGSRAPLDFQVNLPQVEGEIFFFFEIESHKEAGYFQFYLSNLLNINILDFEILFWDIEALPLDKDCKIIKTLKKFTLLSHCY